MDEQPKSQLVAKLKSANYVLVTVSRNPTVDQLAALIGLTLLLNKAGKHAAAVFSGAVPSTLSFLKPEDTIETTTDSLRDFIIALDKSKADKLRYKVEDDVVRIFITPYRTSITDADLNFSQGDFNVDVVVALGVTEQQDLDEAIISHGRILHDATVATVNLSAAGDLGSIHWQEPKASSLSEMVTGLVQPLSKENGKDLIDNQIATALLTGIVAETDRFSNDKTTAAVMSASAILMAAGANQQLVATELSVSGNGAGNSNYQNQSSPTAFTDTGADSNTADNTEASEPAQTPDGSLAISHETAVDAVPEVPNDDADLDLILNPNSADGNNTDDHENKNDQIEYVPEEPVPAQKPESRPESNLGGSKMITEPPTLGGQLTANSHVEVLEPSSDPLGVPSSPPSPLLSRNSPLGSLPSQPAPDVQPSTAPEPKPMPIPEPEVTLPAPVSQAPIPDTAHQTLSELEAAVHADEAAQIDQTGSVPAEAQLDAARDEVNRALNSIQDQPLPPVDALNAQPMTYDLHPDSESAVPNSPVVPAPQPQKPDLPFPTTPSDQDAAMTKMLHQEVPSLPLPPPTAFDPGAFSSVPTPQVIDPNAAPPVPPPIPFNFGAPTNPPT